MIFFKKSSSLVKLAPQVSHIERYAMESLGYRNTYKNYNMKKIYTLFEICSFSKFTKDPFESLSRTVKLLVDSEGCHFPKFIELNICLSFFLKKDNIIFLFSQLIIFDSSRNRLRAIIQVDSQLFKDFTLVCQERGDHDYIPTNITTIFIPIPENHVPRNFKMENGLLGI